MIPKMLQDGRRGKITFRIKPHTRQRAQTLCTPGPRDPTETETELCLSVSCRGTGQQWPSAGAGALGAANLGMTQALLKEVTIIFITSTIVWSQVKQQGRNRALPIIRKLN